MRFLPFLLFLPCLSRAECGDCTEVHKEIERQRQRDAELHGCRSCKALDLSSEGCPSFGYDCDEDFGVTISQLTAASQGQCIEARCAGPFAKLSVAGNIVNRVRCNNSQWMSGANVAEPVVCAKPCNGNACAASHSKASADFSALTIHPATAQTAGVNKCATGDCANGMVAINSVDGSLLFNLDWITGVNSVGCTGNGVWAYGASTESKHVMCNSSPCGPSRCPSLVFGEGMMNGLVAPLTITGNGAQCATATCEAGFVQMTGGGDVQSQLGGFTELTCKADGTWADPSDNIYINVMCNVPPCAGDCDEVPFFSPSLDPAVILNQPIRKGCSYSCPEDQSLFRSDSFGGPISAEKATCEGGKYTIDDTITADQISCWKCDLEDQQMEAESEVKPFLTQCVLWCPDGYIIEYYQNSDPTIKTKIRRLHRQISGFNPQDPSKPAGNYWDSEKNSYQYGVQLACVPI